ncbi:CCHC-type domain-containing protein [Nephila pilipes]|uniref:CCHC-type domain-containing protein n=1 Tax=Nephila pilipes TaxID=299642 RepID=A0A8X6UTS8_NEPPI|nr:CCHC-type domain-containing protein [Nephila pilipes]GFU42570.1 CCHC-type domain-containing protein [Nephila pilipes]
MLFPLVESALPEETLLAWERYRSTSRKSHDEENQNSKITTKTELDSILEFLQDEVQAEDYIVLASQNLGFDAKPNYKSFQEKKAGNNKHKHGDTRQIASAPDLLTSSKAQRQCIFCHNFHNSADCIKVRKMPMKDGENLIEKTGCCFLCLKSGH